MKQLNRITVKALLFISIQVQLFAQDDVPLYKPMIIESYRLAITFNKTTSLIFPSAIKSVDRGSRDVLAQKAGGVENILLVKAGKENFGETSLSVVTTDGKFYSFLVDYASNPSILTISFDNDTHTKHVALLLQPVPNETELRINAERIASEKRFLHGVKDKKYEMRFQLNGLYIKGDVLFYQLQVKNHSNLNYDMDLLRFFIKDKKKYKRTAVQELEVQPLYVYGDTATVKSRSNDILVFALPKFTLAGQKYLCIELMERNGGRHLELKVRNSTLLKANPITF